MLKQHTFTLLHFSVLSIINIQVLRSILLEGSEFFADCLPETVCQDCQALQVLSELLTWWRLVQLLSS